MTSRERKPIERRKRKARAAERRSEIAARYEQRNEARLSLSDERRLRSNVKAWKFFESQAPWYRRTAIFCSTFAISNIEPQGNLQTETGGASQAAAPCPGLPNIRILMN